MSDHPSDCNCEHLRSLIDDLERAKEDLEEFGYVVSHDLREPLIGIAGFGSLLKRRYADRLDEQGKHFIDEIVNGVKRMETKIDDLLALSRAGQLTPSSGPFSLGAAIEEAKRNLVGSIKEFGAAIHVEGPMPLVNGDRSLIAQVFQNLFSNSIKYRKPDETPLIVVGVKPCKDDDGMWCVTVRDNGIGFEMAHKDRIWKVFQRLYTVEQYPGTGIGLAIVKKIIERHGGDAWATSEPDQGSQFFFTLPKAP